MKHALHPMLHMASKLLYICEITRANLKLTRYCYKHMKEQTNLLKFTADGKPFDIPVDGSLGILALGAVGVKAWRERRKETGYKILNTDLIRKTEEAESD